jgi:hypothetical protein
MSDQLADAATYTTHSNTAHELPCYQQESTQQNQYWSGLGPTP